MLAQFPRHLQRFSSEKMRSDGRYRGISCMLEIKETPVLTGENRHGEKHREKERESKYSFRACYVSL